jgi:HNH endonuclease
METRKAISKRTRFEVFKRDSFTCQYCGESAPKVLLEIDHIEPVSKGGKNSMINLITSCEACNGGKSDKRLSDDTAVTKQHTQLALIQDRREQLAMMMKWSKQCEKLKEEEIDAVQSWIVPRTFSESFRATVGKLIKTHGLARVYAAMQDSVWTYPDDIERACCKLKTFIEAAISDEELPGSGRIPYILAVLRNRLRLNVHAYKETRLAIEEFIRNGGDIEELVEESKHCSSMKQFFEAIDYGQN